MPQLRSPIHALQYSLERRRIAQGNAETIGQGLQSGIQTGLAIRESRARDAEDKRRFNMEQGFREDQSAAADDYRRAMMERDERGFQAGREDEGQRRAEFQMGLGAKTSESLRESAATKEYRDAMLRQKGMELFGGAVKSIAGGVADWRKESNRVEEKGRTEDRAARGETLRVAKFSQDEFDREVARREKLIAQKEKEIESFLPEQPVDADSVEKPDEKAYRRRLTSKGYRASLRKRNKMAKDHSWAGLPVEEEPEWFAKLDELDALRDELDQLMAAGIYGTPETGQQPAQGAGGTGELWRD